MCVFVCSFSARTKRHPHPYFPGQRRVLRNAGNIATEWGEGEGVFGLTPRFDMPKIPKIRNKISNSRECRRRELRLISAAIKLASE